MDTSVSTPPTENTVAPVPPIVTDSSTTMTSEPEIVQITDISIVDIDPNQQLPPEVVKPDELILGIGSANNLFQTSTDVRGFSISAISKNNKSSVDELGILAIDDISGKVDGIAPGQPGYLKAVVDKSILISSFLNNSFLSKDKQEIGLDPNRIYELIKVNNGSLADAVQQINNGQTPTNIQFSLPDVNGNSPIKITSNSTNDGYVVSANNDDLVLAVTKLSSVTPNQPIGTKSQRLVEGRTIDLTDFTNENLTVDLKTTSDAAYKNNIGFYAVEDEIGTIKTTTGNFVKPGDPTYATEAIKNAIANAGLHLGKTDSKANQAITGGKIYAPVLVAQGDLNDFLSKNSTNAGDGNVVHAYFNYISANPDQLDHFRVLGSNTFGVEDTFGGGDKDYNDLVVQMTIKSDAQITLI